VITIHKDTQIPASHTNWQKEETEKRPKAEKPKPEPEEKVTPMRLHSDEIGHDKESCKLCRDTVAYLLQVPKLQSNDSIIREYKLMKTPHIFNLTQEEMMALDNPTNGTIPSEEKLFDDPFLQKHSLEPIFGMSYEDTMRCLKSTSKAFTDMANIGSILDDGNRKLTIVDIENDVYESDPDLDNQNDDSSDSEIRNIENSKTPPRCFTPRTACSTPDSFTESFCELKQIEDEASLRHPQSNQPSQSSSSHLNSKSRSTISFTSNPNKSKRMTRSRSIHTIPRMNRSHRRTSNRNSNNRARPSSDFKWKRPVTIDPRLSANYNKTFPAISDNVQNLQDQSRSANNENSNVLNVNQSAKNATMHKSFDVSQSHTI
jgi:hypothetical protein